ncbi:glycosyltransferase family 4 protein [Yersinia mollaretii]|uniref:glycosyltransferase family 4 protein n=1 Tax=Yersinia mollaretii TaxID=33060 RepID=UPI0011A29B2C|nr:glycosyltransferase family 4 protein [Yersinia mollaretii]
MALLINHVMSNETSSSIFTDILNYYKEFSGEDICIVESIRPINDADIYHYHRPHLEKELMSNSVVTVHHDIKDTDKWLAYEKFHDRYSEAKLVFCLNKSQQEILNEKGILNTFVIPHGYNSKILTPPKRPKKSNGKITIGIISKRYERKVKGEAHILELYKRLDSTKFKFIFVGEGRSISARKARTYGFETECFERLPYLCFNDLYKNIDILLITSLYEGGPASIPEAIISGTPIVSTPIGMALDYVVNGSNGIFLTGDYDSDMKNISSFTEESIFNEFSSNAFNCCNQALSWEQVISLFVGKYKELAENKNEKY